jgi:hypothetical protein
MATRFNEIFHIFHVLRPYAFSYVIFTPMGTIGAWIDPQTMTTALFSIILQKLFFHFFDNINN